MIYEIGLKNEVFFGVKEFFPLIQIYNMGGKGNFRIIRKNHASDIRLALDLYLKWKIL